MTVWDVLGRLSDHPPSLGPEWGSGGIFGLKYYRGVLYYTLAFDAIAHFVREDGVDKYRFELVGPGPVSGGDTYNAVDAVDDVIYFGGWVHAPAAFIDKGRGIGVVSFRNKFSHIHAYDISERRVRLLWKEGAGREDEWAGEVSEIIYNPVKDELLIARGDGTINLGVYAIDRNGGSARRISESAALKGAVLYEYACFDVLERHIKDVRGVLFTKAVTGFQCVDTLTDEVIRTPVGDIAKRSVDGSPVSWPQTGPIASAYGRLFAFVKGGVFVGNPIDESLEQVRFVRLFDFGDSGYYARRTAAKSLGGGILVAFNAYSESVVRPTNPFEETVSRGTNTIVGPSVLLYMTPPVARVVFAAGARITSFEPVGDVLVLATNTMSNTSRYNATPIDTGYRGFSILPLSILDYQSPPVRFSVPANLVRDRTFGGIPLAGYSRPRLRVLGEGTTNLLIYEYDLSLPPQQADVERFELKGLRDYVDLSGFGNSIVAMRLLEPDLRSRVIVDLM
ncbi:MAG: DUF2139 domain-containing protein [Acidilobus sp.]